MNKTISTKMLIRIWGSTMILFVCIVGSSLYYSKQEVIRGTEEHSRNLAQYYAEKYEGKFQKAQTIAEMLALYVTNHPEEQEANLRRILEAVLKNHGEIYGTCIAFEPDAYEKGRHYFAPYYYNQNGTPTFVQLGTPEYDYFNRDWYKVPRSTEKPFWTEPYVDTGGGEALMITYSSPFFLDGKFSGIATIDINLSELTDETNRIRVLNSGYAFIISRSGRLISYPDKSKIMNTNLTSISPEAALKMKEMKQGFLDLDDPLHGSRAWLVFNPIPSTEMTIAVVYAFREVMARVYNFEKTAIWLGMVGLFALLLIVALVSRSIARPVIDLANAVREVSAGHLDFELPRKPSNDEVGELTFAFNKMVKDLRQHIDELQKTTAEKERITSELDIAWNIQKSILPSVFPPFPEIDHFDICARSLPAKEVGGDFYDFFLLDNRRLGFVIGDVSGKGVPAALFMAVCRTLLKSTALGNGSPGDCLTRVNDLLVPENEMMMFVTVFYGVLNYVTGEIEYANAGHNPPCMMTKNGVTDLKSQVRLPLGVMENIAYPTMKTRLETDETIFLYTDGITEAMNEQDELYDFKRLIESLEKIQGSTPEKLINGVLKNLEKFTGNALQSDDITALALVYHGTQTGRAKSFCIENRLSEVQKIHEEMALFCRNLGVSKPDIQRVNLALEEILVNIIHYGFDDDSKHFIDIAVSEIAQNELKIVIEDSGREFNPLENEQPDTGMNVESRPIGGLGIHLVVNLMDSVTYDRKDGKNLLTFTKKYE